MVQRLKQGLAVLVWVVFIGLAYLLMEHSAFGGGDFHLYYTSVRDYLPAQLPYPSVIGTLRDSWTYPPLLGQLLIPLVMNFDLVTATRLWFAFNVGLLLLLIALFARMIPARQRIEFWIVAAAFVPAFETLRIGQASLLITVLVAFAWLAVKRDRPALAGGLLATAAWIKVYPALIILYFVWTRNGRVIRGVLIVGIALAGLQIAISGVDVLVEFFRSLLLVAGQGDIDLMWRNISIYGFAANFFQDHVRSTPLLVNSAAYGLTRIGLSALVLGSLFVLSARSNASRTRFAPLANAGTRFDNEYALTIVTMLLLSPWVYIDSVAPIFVAVFIVWQNAESRQDHLWLAVAGLAVATGYLLVWHPADSFSAPLLALGFYALMIVWMRLIRRLLPTAPRQS
ncbi:MAG: glycosyltransferase family 87 protein [Chloroflexota bacterium]|nr:glycosyltransferase family 87 protein [Chloroflexota bacterium]